MTSCVVGAAVCECVCECTVTSQHQEHCAACFYSVLSPVEELAKYNIRKQCQKIILNDTVINPFYKDTVKGAITNFLGA